MNNKALLWITLAGTLFCTLLAVLFFFGVPVFNVNRPPLYLITLGFAGSLSLALFKQKRSRDVVFVNILIYFIFAVVSQALKAITALILLIYYASLVLALYVYTRYFDKNLGKLVWARPLVLAGLLALFYIAANTLHSLMFIRSFEIRFLLMNMPIGFLLGLGIGLGQVFTERYLLHGNK